MEGIKLFFAIIPTLILFLYGIENFSQEIQKLVGEKFRAIISKLTQNPTKGALLGGFITAIVQSSTATTVITVSLVNAGIISFAQSLGIIFGANVGSTVTAQLVALKLTAFAPILIIIGFGLKFLGGRYKLLGKPLFFFGLVFYGLMLVSSAIEPMKTDPRIVEYFTTLSSIPVAILVGFIFTSIVQSSSVTTGLVVVLAQSGLLNLNQAIPLLLGANIGTSTTAFVASLGLNLHAKRVGVANLLFNVIGMLVFLPFITIFTMIIESIGGGIAQQVANAHMIFNILTASLFLIFVDKFKDLVEKLVPGKEEEILYETKYLINGLPDDNTDAFMLIKKELVYSLEITMMIYDESFKSFKRPRKVRFMKLEKLETLNDYLDDKITDALLTVSKRKLTKTEGKKTVLLVQISNAIEQLGDLGEDLGDVSRDLFEKGMNMSYESIEAVDKILRKFRKNIENLQTSFPHISKKLHAELKQCEEQILDIINKKYEEHLNRLQADEDYHGSTFVESISLMETAVSKLREIRKLSEKYSGL